MKKRIIWVDYLKAFACFLVVLGHILQSFQVASVDPHTNITSFIIWFIYLFHMPLFMCMSGYLYCKTKKDFTWEYYKKFEIKKIINLVIPYLTFYLIYLGINVMFSSSVNTPKGLEELIGIINNPMAPYWFLYALLSIFIVVPLLEKMLKNNSKKVFMVFVLLKILSLFIETNIYFIDSIMSYAIYFYMGIFISDKNKLKGMKNVIINLILIIIYVFLALILYKYKDIIYENLLDAIEILFAISGILICANCFRNIQKSKLLDTFKEYTFQIYLTHTIFAAGVRIVLFKIGVTNYWIHLVIGLFASIYIPVMISMISNKIKYTNFFFYPVKTVNELRERKDKNG